jgi:hypothetical protein
MKDSKGSKGKIRRRIAGWLAALTVCWLGGVAFASAPANGPVIESSSHKDVEVCALQQLDDGGISGVIVNHSSAPVRDVVLAVEQRWLWRDERHPGADNPGHTVFARYRGEIAPGATQCFVFHPDLPRTQRDDGTFRAAVSVMGFSQDMRNAAAAVSPAR